MRKYSGVVRSVAVMTITAIMLLYIGNRILSFDKSDKISSIMYIPAALSVTDYNVSNDNSTVTNSQPVIDNQSSEQSGTSSVPAAASGSVKGKIIENTISPYSAGTSYNGVYVKNSTGLSVDIKSLLNANLSFKISANDQPQVLIMHTHTTESFMTETRDYYTSTDSARRTDEKLNMVRLGNIVADKLNAAGIKTLHDTTMHDYPQYNGSYTRAAKTINSYLKKYPSIKIVIDMHRDAVASGSDKVKLTTEIAGKKAAQVMLVMGSQSGSVTNFPSWQENLKLALRFQQIMEVMYPSLARPLSLTSKNYNESLTKGSMLLEMGTDANSLEEVEYSADLVGNALVSLLNTLK